jgi:hypothetical protein
LTTLDCSRRFDDKLRILASISSLQQIRHEKGGHPARLVCQISPACGGYDIGQSRPETLFPNMPRLTPRSRLMYCGKYLGFATFSHHRAAKIAHLRQRPQDFFDDD